MNDDKKFDAKQFSDDLHDQIHRDIHASVNTYEQQRKKWRYPFVFGRQIGPGNASPGLFWGALMALCGLALLLDHMGIISFDRIWRFWPLLMVLAGIANFMIREKRIWGIFLVIAGVLIQLNQLGVAHFSWADFWPLMLIAAGLMLMWGSIESRRRLGGVSSGGDDPRTTINGMAVFSGLERRVTTQDFQGGNVTAVFGGVEIDLTEANMQADEALLEVNAIFGGAEIRVPDSWQVSYRGAPIFGGIEDKTRTRRSEDPANPKRKLLIVSGAVIFGGLEIKN